MKPTVDTKFHIDYDWWERSREDLRTYLLSHLPPEARDRMAEAHEEREVDFVDPETGEVLDPGETGEIAERGEFPCFFAEYWEKPEQTAECFVDGPDGEWYLSGDLAHKDEDGYFWFEGRADDVIISAGYRIGPFEVESSLGEHPAVAESAVVPKPDEERGHIVKAFVVLSEGHEPSDDLAEDIRLHVRNELAAHEYPREIEFVDELPKTVTGKIRRTELRDEVEK